MSTRIEPIVFYESKIKGAISGSVIFIPLLMIIISETVFNQADPLYVKYFLTFVIPFLLCFLIFFIRYPSSTLELYTDRFVYRKGRLVVSARWSEVTLIAFQSGQGLIPRAFVIRTKDKSTAWIDTNVLKLMGAPHNKFDLVDFVKELESRSGKTVMWGNVSTNQFSAASFLDYLKGAGMV
jgi:hypothetical protein